MRSWMLASSFATLLATLASSSATASSRIEGDLPRRVWMGAQLSPAEGGGLRIEGVLPGGSAEGKLQPGDVLLGSDDTSFDHLGALGAFLRKHADGDRMRIRILRKDKERLLSLTARAKPLEEATDLEIVYDVVTADDAQLRSITMSPIASDDRLPAVLFIQGLSCSSIDNLQGPLSPVKELLYGLTRSEFVVMRVEKSAVGDSIGGEPCSEIGFHQEVEGFRTALHALKKHPKVDPNRVFVFGHSMGGIQGPLLASSEDVAGVAVFGTGVLGWPEYLVENARRQSRLDDTIDPVEIEQYARSLSRFVHYVLVEKQAVADVVAAHPELAETAAQSFPDGEHGYTRHVRFFQELSDIAPAEVWSQVDTPVLAMVGEYDFATSAYEHQYIADIVNFHHPGTGRVEVIPKLFHGFNVRDSMEQALADPWSGPFGETALDLTVEWMRDVMEK